MIGTNVRLTNEDDSEKIYIVKRLIGNDKAIIKSGKEQKEVSLLDLEKIIPNQKQGMGIDQNTKIINLDPVKEKENIIENDFENDIDKENEIDLGFDIETNTDKENEIDLGFDFENDIDKENEIDLGFDDTLSTIDLDSLI